MVDIRVGVIATVQNNQPGGGNRQEFTPAGKKTKPLKDRRKNRSDRRQGVRDGFIVTLSTQSDRRKKPDRRKK